MAQLSYYIKYRSETVYNQPFPYSRHEKPRNKFSTLELRAGQQDLPYSFDIIKSVTSTPESDSISLFGGGGGGFARLQ